jgi:hypothetical protein
MSSWGSNTTSSPSSEKGGLRQGNTHLTDDPPSISKQAEDNQSMSRSHRITLYNTYHWIARSLDTETTRTSGQTWPPTPSRNFTHGSPPLQ